MSNMSENLSMFPDDGTNTTTWQLRGYPLAVAVYYTFLSPITIAGNGFLLLTFARYSASFLRAPSNFLLLSMAAANFLTGIAVQPLAAYEHYMIHYKGMALLTVQRVAVGISMVTMNTSILSVCGFSWENFLAVFRPCKYKVWITVRRVKIFIMMLWVYEIIFASLPLMYIPRSLVYRIDLHLNTTLISILLICSYICLYVALRRQSNRVKRSPTNNKFPGSGSFAQIGRVSSVERRLRVWIFLFTLVTTIPILPITVVWHLRFYCSVCRENRSIRVAESVLNQFLFIKFALDPFVYAWRLSKYRSALKRIVCCCRDESLV